MLPPPEAIDALRVRGRGGTAGEKAGPPPLGYAHGSGAPPPLRRASSRRMTQAAAQPQQPAQITVPNPGPSLKQCSKRQAAVDDPETYKYHLRHGTAPLLEAAVAWYQRHYGAAAALDPAKEALCLVGSQEGLAHLLLAVADPGDGLLMCDVG